MGYPISHRLPINQKFLDLVHLDDTVLDSRLILSQASDHHQSFVVRESTCRRRRVGKQDQERETPDSACGADDDESVESGTDDRVRWVESSA